METIDSYTAIEVMAAKLQGITTMRNVWIDTVAIKASNKVISGLTIVSHTVVMDIGRKIGDGL